MSAKKLDTILRQRGGLDGLARELGQYDPDLIEDDIGVNANEARDNARATRSTFLALALRCLSRPVLWWRRRRG